MADLPGLTYGRITGRFAAAVADTPSDPGEYPDVLPMTGQITFTPMVGAVRVVGAIPPLTLAPVAITVDLDADGDLSLNGNKGVYLVATDGPLSVTGWVWRVQFRLALNGQTIDIPQIDIAVPGGSTTDVTEFLPVSAGGNVVPQPVTPRQEVFIGGTVAPTAAGPAVWFKAAGSGLYELWVQE